MFSARLYVGAVVRVEAFTENGSPIIIFDNTRGIFDSTLALKHSVIERILAGFVARTGDFLLPFKAVESILPAIAKQRALDPDLKVILQAFDRNSRDLFPVLSRAVLYLASQVSWLCHSTSMCLPGRHWRTRHYYVDFCN